MATTAILRNETLSLRGHTFPLRSRGNPNHKLNSRREPESMVNKPPGKNLVMGQVKILKRGEPLIAVAAERPDRSLDQSRSEEEDVDFSFGSTNRLGPDPETMQKQIQIEEFKNGGRFYAGSSSSSLLSPPPSSVPVPGFLGRTSRVCT